MRIHKWRKNPLFSYNKAWWQWLYIYTERCCSCRSCSSCWMSGRRAAHVYLHDVGVKWRERGQGLHREWEGCREVEDKKKEMKNESWVSARFLRRAQKRRLSFTADITICRWRYSTSHFFLLGFLIQIIRMISCTLYWYGTKLKVPLRWTLSLPSRRNRQQKLWGSGSQRGYGVGGEAAANVQIVVVVMCNYHRSFHGTLGETV